MALGKTRVTKLGYKTAYTVPAGKRAVVSTTAFANTGAEIALVPTALGMNPATDEYPKSVATTAVTINTTITGNDQNQLGYAIAIDGNYAVVGNGPNGSQIGRVLIYFFNGSSWTLQQTIPDPTSASSTVFGTAVAISGDQIIVGAYGNDQDAPNSGRAYRYTRSGTTWTLTNTYPNPSLNSADQFGSCVAIAGDYIVIGADGFSGGDFTGRAYGYRVSTGATLQQTFTNPSGGQEFFGASVACWADGRVLIGARGYSGGNAIGRVYYYASFTTSSVTATLSNPNGNNPDRFGSTVVCDKTGTFFAVGADNFNGGGATGRVYTYSTTAPTTVIQTISNPSNQSSSFFGTGLAMDSLGNLLVGSYLHNGTATDQGRAYRYNRSANTWTLVETIENPAPAASDNFGFGVALSVTPVGAVADSYIYKGCTLFIEATVENKRLFIGAPQDDSPASNSGSVLINSVIQLLTPAQKSTFEAQVDAYLSLIGDNTVDRLSMRDKQTFERTGLVLDAGESVVVALTAAAGDISVQVRGLEEDV